MPDDLIELVLDIMQEERVQHELVKQVSSLCCMACDIELVKQASSLCCMACDIE